MVPEDDNPKVRVLNEITVKIDLDDADANRIVSSTSKGMLDRDALALLAQRIGAHINSSENGESFSEMHKNALGEHICGALGIEWLDSYIGRKNGVVSLEWMEVVLDALPENSDEEGEEITRNDPVTMTARELLDGLAGRGDLEIVVPSYQRASTQWNKKKQRALIDSMVRNIPMPSIVLGKLPDSDTWQLIDGQQRLINLRRFIEPIAEIDTPFKTENGQLFEEMQSSEKQRIERYPFNVERIEASSVRTLGEIYNRYNTSGVNMKETQVRIAVYHHTSALHHGLLALAGGPLLEDTVHDDQALQNLGIDLRTIGNSAPRVRELLPRFKRFRPEERNQVEQTTEQTYEILCRAVGYAAYHRTLGESEGQDMPTTKNAIRSVLGHWARGATAESLCNHLISCLDSCRIIFQDYAFVRVKFTRTDPDENGEMFINGWEALSNTKANGWVLQVQVGGLWGSNIDHVRLIRDKRRQFIQEWALFYAKEMDNVKQNSKTLWRAQHEWRLKVNELIDEWSRDDGGQGSDHDFY